jgi:hypothetical protein
MLEFTPTSSGGGGILSAMFGMETGHYVGSALAILSGIIGLALYRKINKVTIAVSLLSVLLGLMFLAIINMMTMMGMMAVIAELTLLVGIIGIVGSALLKKKKADK